MDRGDEEQSAESAATEPEGRDDHEGRRDPDGPEQREPDRGQLDQPEQHRDDARAARPREEPVARRREADHERQTVRLGDAVRTREPEDPELLPALATDVALEVEPDGQVGDPDQREHRAPEHQRPGDGGDPALRVREPDRRDQEDERQQDRVRPDLDRKERVRLRCQGAHAVDRRQGGDRDEEEAGLPRVVHPRRRQHDHTEQPHDPEPVERDERDRPRGSGRTGRRSRSGPARRGRRGSRSPRRSGTSPRRRQRRRAGGLASRRRTGRSRLRAPRRAAPRRGRFPATARPRPSSRRVAARGFRSVSVERSCRT